MDKCGILGPDDSFSQGQHHEGLKTEWKKKKGSNSNVRQFDFIEWDQSFSYGFLGKLLL